LPDWQAFATRRKGLDPVRAFLGFVAHELGGIPKGHVIDPNRLFLVDDDDSRLTELQRSWYRWLTARPKDAWVDLLQLSPLAFGLGSSVVTPAWAEPGFAYIAAGAIRWGSDAACAKPPPWHRHHRPHCGHAPSAKGRSDAGPAGGHRAGPDCGTPG
jgi:hypothetical protein